MAKIILDGRSKKARALKAAATEGIRNAAEAARLQEECVRIGGVGLKGTYAPLEFKESTEARRHQVGGDHYASKAIQPWDAMECWLSPEGFREYLRGNAIKYLARCNEKGGLEDIQKAQHYLEKLIEVSGG